MMVLCFQVRFFHYSKVRFILEKNVTKTLNTITRPSLKIRSTRRYISGSMGCQTSRRCWKS